MAARRSLHCFFMDIALSESKTRSISDSALHASRFALAKGQFIAAGSLQRDRPAAPVCASRSPSAPKILLYHIPAILNVWKPSFHFARICFASYKILRFSVRLFTLCILFRFTSQTRSDCKTSNLLPDFSAVRLASLLFHPIAKYILFLFDRCSFRLNISLRFQKTFSFLRFSSNNNSLEFLNLSCNYFFAPFQAQCGAMKYSSARIKTCSVHVRVNFPSPSFFCLRSPFFILPLLRLINAQYYQYIVSLIYILCPSNIPWVAPFNLHQNFSFRLSLPKRLFPNVSSPKSFAIGFPRQPFSGRPSATALSQQLFSCSPSQPAFPDHSFAADLPQRLFRSRSSATVTRSAYSKGFDLLLKAAYPAMNRFLFFILYKDTFISISSNYFLLKNRSWKLHHNSPFDEAVPIFLLGLRLAGFVFSKTPNTVLMKCPERK